MKAAIKDPDVRRLLGLEGDFGKLLGVDNEWAYRTSRTSATTARIYDATFGDKGAWPAARH